MQRFRPKTLELLPFFDDQFSKKKLKPPEERDFPNMEEFRKAVEKHKETVNAIAETHKRCEAGRVLLITNKCVKDDLQAAVGPDVAVRNFDAMRGNDCFKDSDAVFVTGRPIPTPDALELATQALTETEVSAFCDNWYPAKVTKIKMRGGPTASLNGPYHPDETADMMLEATVDEEILQCINRLRLILRSSEKPAVVYLATNHIPETLIVDQLVTAEQMYPTKPMTKIMADVGIAKPAPAIVFAHFEHYLGKGVDGRYNSKRRRMDRNRQIARTCNKRVLKKFLGFDFR